MSKSVLDKFGEVLVENVRDRTISNWDKILSGKMKGLSAQQVLEKIGGFNEEQKEALRWLVPKIVDVSLHNYLAMIEEYEDINVEVVNNGQSGNIRELSDGLAGELYTEDGWISRFSKERYEEI
ncbi:epimerase|uniref:Uncharacterized protein n=1 Tax=Dendrosporobacter quercicolus TaxID=146817 RepID=A0A1G9KL60_9FIRM|nr:hypothetical protein [Dendrosporobacter quercicolus]NSL49713.1 epimerase [Dendrosporobacter quercicolus DSM 1736]SDL50153.1 hypothetical protein SAMN04488502_10164 [Dendrosporobacter quercicolus]